MREEPKSETLKRNIMRYVNGCLIEEIDFSLNRSMEELLSSYFEAHGAGVDMDDDYTEEEKSDYSVLENYLSDMGAI